MPEDTNAKSKRSAVTALAMEPNSLVQRLAAGLLARAGLDASPEKLGEQAGVLWSLARMQRHPDPDWKAATPAEAKAAAVRAYLDAQARRMN